MSMDTDAPAPSLPALGAEVLARTAASVVLVDGRARVVDANDAARAALGELRGADAVSAMAAPRHASEVLRVLRTVARTGTPAHHEHNLPPGELGRRCMAWVTTRVVDDPPLLACVGVDVSAARNAVDGLVARSLADELTGLPNRAHLVQVMERMAGSSATVMFCDLNGFKAVNDRFGHAAGDAVLVEVGRRLRLAVRGEDFVARLGGDEFVIVAPPDPSASPTGLSRRVLSAMRQPMLLGGGVVVVVGVSIGTAALDQGLDPAHVLDEADARMYAAKSLRPSQAGALPDRSP